MKKKTFLILGLDNFGFSLARELYGKGQEVIVVDMNEKRIAEIREEVSEAVVSDATDRDTIEELGLDKVDAAVVSLGETKIGASVLATLHLKEMGIENIVVKAISSEHGRIVEKIGATQVVFPEHEIAERLATKLSLSHVFEEVDFPEGYSLIEILAPKKLQGKTLQEAQIRSKYGITVVWIRRTKDDGKVVSILPAPSDEVYQGDVLFVLGLQEDIDKFKELEV